MVLTYKVEIELEVRQVLDVYDVFVTVITEQGSTPSHYDKTASKLMEQIQHGVNLALDCITLSVSKLPEYRDQFVETFYCTTSELKPLVEWLETLTNSEKEDLRRGGNYDL